MPSCCRIPWSWFRTPTRCCAKRSGCCAPKGACSSAASIPGAAGARGGCSATISGGRRFRRKRAVCSPSGGCATGWRCSTSRWPTSTAISDRCRSPGGGARRAMSPPLDPALPAAGGSHRRRLPAQGAQARADPHPRAPEAQGAATGPRARVGADQQSRSMTEVEIYTDGACRGNPGPGGWAALLIAGKRAQGALRRRAGDHQQPHGAHGRHRRAGGAQAPLRGAALHRFEVRAAGGDASGCRSGRRAAGAPPRAKLSRTRIYGRGSMRPRRRKISNGTGSRGIRATTATNTWISSRTAPSI